MGPGLKKKSVSCSVTSTAAHVTDATLATQIAASTFSNTSPSTQTSGAGVRKRTCVRGPTRGIGVRKLIAQFGGKKLDVYVALEMRAFSGINATKVAVEFGVQIRSSCPIEGFFKSWRHVDAGLKGAIVQTVRADKNQKGLPPEERLRLVERLPDFCDTYKASHTLKYTQDWIDTIGKEKHEKMVAVRDQAKQSGTPLTAEELSRAVLGERKNYIRGFGNGPKLSTYISKSKSYVACQGQLQKFQAEMESLREEHRKEREDEKIRRKKEHEEARLRKEEQTRRYEQLQSNNETMQRELDNIKKCMIQFQKCGRITMGSM